MFEIYDSSFKSQCVSGFAGTSYPHHGLKSITSSPTTVHSGRGRGEVLPHNCVSFPSTTPLCHFTLPCKPLCSYAGDVSSPESFGQGAAAQEKRKGWRTLISACRTAHSAVFPVKHSLTSSLSIIVVIMCGGLKPMLRGNK